MDLGLPEISRLARITALVALRNEAGLEQELRTALAAGLEPSSIRETILQSYLFAGYAAAINAFIVLNRLLPGEESFLQEEEKSLSLWKRRGAELCRRIYGSQFEKLVQNMNSLHPDLADWMIWEGYGKVLSRPYLSPRVRELLIVCMTAVLSVERQFVSHVRGALNVGATPHEVLHVFDDAVPFMVAPKIEPFRAIVQEYVK